MRTLLLLRPEPGLSASVERAKAMELDVLPCPLFRVEPVDWIVPIPAGYDGLLLTSTNAVRYGGTGLEALRHLPVHAVGAATAAAARGAGFHVRSIGSGDLTDLLAGLPTSLRLLWLAGEDRREAQSREGIAIRIVYRSIPIQAPALPSLEGMVVAVHSPRAGSRLAELAGRRARTAIAAISAAAAEACGTGWERIEIAVQPDDSAVLALAAMLCHTMPPQ
jgi:uroporphyrinogen-III synthase